MGCSGRLEQQDYPGCCVENRLTGWREKKRGQLGPPAVIQVRVMVLWTRVVVMGLLRSCWVSDTFWRTRKQSLVTGCGKREKEKSLALYEAFRLRNWKNGMAIIWDKRDCKGIRNRCGGNIRGWAFNLLNLRCPVDISAAKEGWHLHMEFCRYTFVCHQGIGSIQRWD